MLNGAVLIAPVALLWDGVAGVARGRGCPAPGVAQLMATAVTLMKTAKGELVAGSHLPADG
jgi:hypothetical protein